MQTFGSRLKLLRKSKKLTQKYLADLFKLAESTISMYERDEREPSFELTNRLADFFEVTTDYLHGRTDDPNSLSSIDKLNKSNDDQYDSLNEINKLIKEYGIEQMGFFDIEQWKNLSPDDVDEIRRHFEWVAQKAKERNEKE